ncbi:MAG: hypothetical protein WBD22_03415 [Pyrinomonadaceae bacterium]
MTTTIKKHSPAVLETVRTLMNGAIDYAGLFPPSQLPMPDAVQNFAKYSLSDHNWMLGRFVVGLGKLPEFLAIFDEFETPDCDTWRISVVASADISETIERISRTNEVYSGRLACDSVEIKSVSLKADIKRAAASLPDHVTAFFEVAVDEYLDELIAAIAASGQRAKIRTGGVTADAFPTAAEIVRFVQACTSANVPFKATAGLHHPLRCLKPLTYAPEAPRGMMHGFLNMFLMTGFCRNGHETRLLEELMGETAADHFKFAENHVIWRDRALDVMEIKSLRADGIMSFGSCSFDEPIDDLRSLGLL